MIEAKKDFAAESGHWYALDGTPKYTIVGANGKERGTTLRDARKFGLLPSVTEIIKQAPKPALDVWKQKQVMLAALTLPRRPDESEQVFCDRILADSKEEARMKAERGAALHGAIECGILGRPRLDEWEAHVDAVFIACAKEGAMLGGGEAEKSFAHPLGFGGKVDWHSRELGIVLDFKTKDEITEKTITYDEHEMQLCAYRLGLGMPTARRFIVFVGVNDKQVKVCELPEENAARCEAKFLKLLEYWQIDKGYFPGKAVAA